MPDPILPMVNHRSALLHRISELGDFQPGSIANASRRRGKPGRHCAKPNDPGYGLHSQLTRKIDGRTATQNLPSPWSTSIGRSADCGPSNRPVDGPGKKTAQAVLQEVAREVDRLSVIFQDRRKAGRFGPGIRRNLHPLPVCE